MRLSCILTLDLRPACRCEKPRVLEHAVHCFAERVCQTMLSALVLPLAPFTLLVLALVIAIVVTDYLQRASQARAPRVPLVRHILTSSLLLAGVSACSGGSHLLPTAPAGFGSGVQNGVKAATIGNLQQPNATATAGPAGIATFTFSIPPKPSGRLAHYISAATRSVIIHLSSVNGARPPQGVNAIFNTVSGAKGCYDVTVLTCRLDVSVPAGTDAFTVSLQSGLNGNGNILSQASVSAGI